MLWCFSCFIGFILGMLVYMANSTLSAFNSFLNWKKNIMTVVRSKSPLFHPLPLLLVPGFVPHVGNDVERK